MAIGNDKDNAQRQPAKQPGSDTRLFQAMLAAGFALFLAGSALFIYLQSRNMGLPELSRLAPSQPTPALGARAPAAATKGGAPGFAHQIGPCTSCHSSPGEQGQLYLAIDGRDVSDDPAITLRAGGAFELAFHFEGLLGDPARYAGVGVEVVLPERGSWSLGPGSGKPVDGWSPAGSGRTFWSLAWKRAGAGDTGQGGRWRAIAARPGAFYLDFSASKWAVSGNAAAAANRGAAGDGDGRADAMGGDALISVPLNEQPGKYELLVAAIGRDGRGNPAQLSRRIAVQVEPAPALPAPSAFATPLPFRRFHDSGGKCGGCHLSARKVPAGHQGRPNESCLLCHVMNNSGAPSGKMIPRVPHATEDRADCLSCHDAGGIRPVPADHAGRPIAICLTCHSPATDHSSGTPKVPHTVKDRTNCLTCHSSYFVPPTPASHQGRGSEACASCHQQGVTRATRGAPDIPHATTGRTDCLGCHRTGFFKVMPEATHAGRNDLSCRGCHRPADGVTVSGTPRLIPHDTEGRAECLACHGPAGLRPVPQSHVGRLSATCSGCHRPAIDRSGLVPRIPHVVAGREACLTCHAAYFIPPVPRDHEGRPNEVCAACHTQAAAPSPTPTAPATRAAQGGQR